MKKHEYITFKVFFAVGIASVAFAYSSFFLQGLRLFDNDYNQWLTFAQENSLSAVFWQIFNPVLSDWNVNFRPVQTLIFKTLFALFDYKASGYYYFKSLMLAGFAASYFLFLRSYLNSQAVAALSALLLVVSSSTFTSLYWVSDFVILSEFLALLVFALFLHLESLDNPDRKKVLVILALMVLLTLICDRTKANGKLIPGILFIYLALTDWRKLKRYGPAIALMVAIVLPWPVLLADPAPFLAAKAGAPASYAWQPASLQKFWTLFGGDFAPFSLLYKEHPPISVLAILGFPLVYTGAAGLVFLACRRSSVPPATRLLCVWAAVNIVALMSYPTLPQYFQARYAISALIPLIPLVLFAIHRTAGAVYMQRQIPTIFLTLLVVIQIGFHTHYTVQMRNIGMPGFMIASDKTREFIADNFSDTVFYYYKMPVYAFKPTTDGNQFYSSIYDNLQDVISLTPQGVPLFVISSVPINSPELRFHTAFPGRSDNLYDRIFNQDNRYLPVTFYLYQLL